MNQKQQETLSQVVDATLEASSKLTVVVSHGGYFDRLLRKWGVRPKQRVFIMTPITLGNLLRISKLILKIDSDAFHNDRLLENSYQAMEQHTETLAEIVAVALVNTKSGPSRSLVDFVLREFTAKEMSGCFAIILNSMHVGDFINSIILMRGLSVLEKESKKEPKRKVSPVDQGR